WTRPSRPTRSRPTRSRRSSTTSRRTWTTSSTARVHRARRGRATEHVATCARPAARLMSVASPAAQPGRRQRGLRTRVESWAFFCWSERSEMETEIRHYLMNGGETKPDAREALEWAGETRAKMVDLKFCDLLGTWQHVTLPLAAFDESAIDEGLGFDGSSIRGWQGISESDMLLMPQADTAILDPFTEIPTLSILCEILDPVTREPYSKDPRRIARRAEEYLRSTGVADTSYV